jgi:predicted RNA-binding Zn-ribbon protein involved in translation (DUF1610 family)
MGSSANFSGFGVIVIFLLGIGLGWFLGKVRAGGETTVTFPTGAPSNQGVFTSVKTTTVRNLTWKCQCGAVLNFRDGAGPFPPGVLAMPTGDSFACPKCGKPFDLKAERQLEAGALTNMNRSGARQVLASGSFTCPKCSASIKIETDPQLVAETLASLNLKNKG